MEVKNCLQLLLLFIFFVSIKSSVSTENDETNFITIVNGVRWINNTREGFTFRVSLGSNEEYSVGEIAKGSAVIFVGTEETTNWNVNLFLPNLTMSNQIKIESYPNTNGTIYAEFPPPVNTNLPYHFENWLFADPGRSKVSISTLELYLTNVQNWKFNIKSKTIMDLKGTPIGTSAVMDLTSQSTVLLEDIWSSILISNAIITPHPKLFNEDKTMHFVGDTTKIVVNLTANEKVTYLDGCLIANQQRTNPTHSAWYISQMEYYGFPTNQALNGCSLYTHLIKEIDIQTPFILASQITKKNNTQILTVKNGNLEYKDLNVWKSIFLSDSSIFVNDDFTINLLNGHKVNIFNSFEKDVNFFYKSDLSTNNMTWNFNCLENSVLSWKTSKFNGKLCPAVDKIIPNFVFQSRLESLDLSLSQKYLPFSKDVLRQITWENTTIYIHDDDIGLFNINWMNIDNLNYDMRDVSDWVINYNSPQILNQIFNVKSTNSSVSRLVEVHFQNSDFCQMDINATSFKIDQFHCRDCQIGEFLVEYNGKCDIEMNDSPYGSEVVIKSGSQSMASIHDISNGAIFVSTKTDLLKDISMSNGMLFVAGNNSVTKLNFGETDLLNIEQGCILKNDFDVKPKSEWFKQQAIDLGIPVNEKCSFIATKIQQVEILGKKTVLTKNIDWMENIRFLKILNSNIVLSDDKKCLSVKITATELILLDRLYLTVSEGKSIQISTDFCEQSELRIESYLASDQTKFSINCLNDTISPLMKLKSDSISTLICNIETTSLVPKINLIDASNNSEIFYEVSKTTTFTEDYKFSIFDQSIKFNEKHQLFWNHKLKTTISVEEGTSHIQVEQQLNEVFPPTINFKKTSNVSFALQKNANIKFSKTKLYFNPKTNLIETLSWDESTCLLPRMQCIPQIWVDAKIYERTCLHQNYRKMCDNNIGLIVNADSQIFYCNSTTNETSIQFNSITDMKEPKFEFPSWIFLFYAFMSLLSLTFPIFHIIDFGQSNILLAGIAEQIDTDLSNWSVDARTIVDVSNMITGNSSGWICYDYFSTYQLLSYIFFILAVIAIFFLNGIYILIKSIKIKNKILKINETTKKPYFVEMIQQDLGKFKIQLEFIFVLFSIFILPSVVYMQGTVLLIIFLIVVALYIIIIATKYRLTKKKIILFFPFFFGYLIFIILINYFSLISFGTFEFFSVHFSNIIFSILRLTTLIETLIVLIKNHRDIFKCNIKECFNFCQNIQFYVGYCLWIASLILWFIGMIFGGLFISGVKYEGYDYFITWCLLSFFSGVCQILAKLLVIEVKLCTSCKNAIPKTDQEKADMGNLVLDKHASLLNCFDGLFASKSEDIESRTLIKNDSAQNKIEEVDEIEEELGSITGVDEIVE